jgi:hypothetical protein
MKVQEAIEKINGEGFYSVFEAEEVLDRDAKLVKSNLGIDEYRWYTISTKVYQLEDGYIGITGVTSLKSEAMMFSDCDVITQAEEYEEFTTISYRRKK